MVLLFYFFAVRKSMERFVPIVRFDNQIENLLNRDDQSIANILDLFMKSNSGIHIMRAIEPNIRFGRILRNYLNVTNSIPKCEFWNTDKATKCIRIASRKHLGDAIIKFQSKQSDNI